MTATRPETGDIHPGMTMYVAPSSNSMRRSPAFAKYIEVTVTSAARVWITVTNGGSEWRMRRDTMNEGSKYSGSNSRLVTAEQRAWELRQDQAVSVLRDHGIQIDLKSRWRGREQLLAGLLQGAE